MKTVFAGALFLVVGLSACQKKDRMPEDGMGAGAAPPVATDTTMIDTMRTPAVPMDSLRADTTRRPQ
jgi:hypothetical protein